MTSKEPTHVNLNANSRLCGMTKIIYSLDNYLITPHVSLALYIQIISLH